MDEDEAAYRAAMASDDPDEAAYGALNLGSLLAIQGRFSEAENGVVSVMANRDAIAEVLRRHGALFAYLDHQPSTLSSEPRTDRTVAAWLDPDRPIPDPAVVEAQMPSAVDKVEVLNKAPLNVRDHIGRIAHITIADSEWEGLRVFDTLVEKGVIRASVAEVLSSAEVALDAMTPMATPQQALDTCLDPRTRTPSRFPRRS